MSAFEVVRRLLVGYPVPDEFVDPAYPELLQRLGGLELTLVVAATSLLLGLPLGALLAVGRQGPALVRWPAVLFVEVVRGLPVMLLVLLFVHLSYPLLGVRVPVALLGTAAFTLHAASYASEIFRSGFRAVGGGVVDAARVLGLSRRQTLVHVELSIAVRTMLPAFLGLLITVFKDTSVLIVVGAAELTCTARQITVSQPVNMLPVLFLLLLMYGGSAALASLLVARLERRWPGADPRNDTKGLP